jgi:D-alanyl-D-alanine carboxypeptidase
MRKLAAIVLLALPLSAAPPKDFAAKADAYIKPYVEQSAFSGVVLLAKGDEVVLEKAYGMANVEFAVPNRPDTRFAVASITKRFTGIIIKRLADEKKLAYTDTLSKWAPSFPSADKITIDHLVRHYSGVRDPDKLRRTIRANRTTAEVVELLRVEPLGSEPGATYSYTTANYAILAHIIERVTGRSFAEIVRTYVYEPAGMKDSGELTTTSVVPRLATGYMPNPFGPGLAVCGPEDTSWKAAGGSSYSTVRDLLRFNRAVYAGRLGVDARTFFTHSKLFDRDSMSSSGSFPGASANLLSFPADEVTVVVLSNNYATVPGTITQDLAAMYFGRDVPNAAVKLAANPAPLDPRFLGAYDVEGRTWKLSIVMRDGKPVASWNEIRQSALFRIDDETWFSPLDWARVRFPKEGDPTLQFSTGEPMRLVRK